MSSSLLSGFIAIESVNIQTALNLAKKFMEFAKAADEGENAAAESDVGFAVPERRSNNAKRDVQPRFQQKPKRVTRNKAPIAKPTDVEAASIKNTYKAIMPKFCSICLSGEDKSGRTAIDWLTCGNCETWLHLYCCGDNEESGSLICPTCKSVVTADDEPSSC